MAGTPRQTDAIPLSGDVHVDANVARVEGILGLPLPLNTTPGTIPGVDPNGGFWNLYDVLPYPNIPPALGDIYGNLSQTYVQTINGTAIKTITTSDSPYSVLTTDFFLLADGTSGNISFLLPDASFQQFIGIRRIDSTANAISVGAGTTGQSFVGTSSILPSAFSFFIPDKVSTYYGFYGSGTSAITPSGAASGDLSGNYPNPTVAKINGSLLGTTTNSNAKILISDGAAWQAQSMSADATMTSGGALTLATVNGNVGSFGDATHVGAFTVNAKGLTTSAWNVTITGTAPGGSAGGDLSGTYPNPTVSQINTVPLGTTSAFNANILISDGRAWQSKTMSGDATMTSGATITLATVNGNVGSFGSATQVGAFTVNAKGLTTSAWNITIAGVAPGGTAGGDLSGTYPNPAVAKINGATLGTVTNSSGKIIISDGAAWQAQSISGDITTTSAGVVTVGKINGATLGTVTNASGKILISDGGAWQAQGVGGDLSTTSSGSFTVNKINGSTLGTTTPTLANILVADGSKWSSVAMSGSGTMTSAGVFSLAATETRYAMTLGASDGATLTDAQTIYFGAPGSTITTTDGNRRTYVPKTGTIKVIYVAGIFITTTGTNESWTLSLRLNGTTDTTIAAVASNASPRVWINTALSIAVTQGDYIEIKSVNPTWSTNPANFVMTAQVYIEAS